MNIEPSILDTKLKKRNLKVLERFCNRIHIDVMDGKFVKNKTKDRKSVEQGKSVDLGGRRIMKKKT